MRLLPDTHLLLWLVEEPPDLSAKARDLLEDDTNEVVFSVASLWEVAIKFALGGLISRSILGCCGAACWTTVLPELPVLAEHALATVSLPPIHKDPFDRLLVAQASVEGFVLLTADPILARYPGPIRLV